MYDEEDLREAGRVVRTSVIVVIIMSAAFLAAAILTAIFAANWAGQVVLVAGVCVCIFFWGVRITPAAAYRKFIGEITSGLSRQVRYEVESVSLQPVYKDNRLFYYEVTVRGDDGKERVLLLDAGKARQTEALVPGKEYAFTVYDRYITGIAPVTDQN